jgi:hypothetical protein
MINRRTMAAAVMEERPAHQPEIDPRIMRDLEAGAPFAAAADGTSPFDVGPAEELASAALTVDLDRGNPVRPLTSAIDEVVARLRPHAGLARYTRSQVEFRFTVTDASPVNQTAVQTLGVWVARRWNLDAAAVSCQLEQRDPAESRALIERLMTDAPTD